MRSLVLLLILVTATFSSGCARQRFSYVVPPPGPSNPAGKVVEVLAPTDGRTNRQIDRVLVTNYLSEVPGLLAADLSSTGQFKSVSPQGSNAAPAELLVKTELQRLDWEVPAYNTILGMTFVTSVFTGGIGGLIYLSTSTDVNAVAVVRFELSEVNGGKVVASQAVTGRHTERMAKMSCDTHETKARVVALAFQDAVAQWKAELARALAEPGQARRGRRGPWPAHGAQGLMNLKSDWPWQVAVRSDEAGEVDGR